MLPRWSYQDVEVRASPSVRPGECPQDVSGVDRSVRRGREVGSSEGSQGLESRRSVSAWSSTGSGVASVARKVLMNLAA